MSREILRMSAALELSRLARSVAGIYSVRWRFYAGVAVQRCARELALPVPTLEAVVARTRASLRSNRRVLQLVDHFRATSVFGGFEADVRGLLALVTSSFRSDESGLLDAVEAALGCRRLELAASIQLGLWGANKTRALEMITLGTRRSLRRGGRARFVHCIDPSAAEKFPPSLALGVACARRAFELRCAELATTAARILDRTANLENRDADFAFAYQAALEVGFGSLDAALRLCASGRHQAARDWAHLAVVDAALLADRERDARVALSSIRGSLNRARALVGVAAWRVSRGAVRSARRLIASIVELDVATRERMIGSLTMGALEVPAFHPPRCDCNACRLPRLRPTEPVPDRSPDQAEARQIASDAICAVVGTGVPKLGVANARWMAAGLSGKTPPTADATSLARAYFDEGVSLSASASARRMALIRASGHVLAAEFSSSARLSATLVASRLRTLRNLGGARVERALLRVLGPVVVDAKMQRTRFWRQAFLLLCELSPAAARLLALTRYAELPSDDLLDTLRSQDCVTSSFATSWFALEQARAKISGRKQAEIWMQTLVNVWLEQRGCLPDAAVLEAWLKHCTSATEIVTESIARAERRLVRELSKRPLSFAGSLLESDDLRGWMRALRAPLLLPSDKAWTDQRLRDALEMAVNDKCGSPDTELVQKFVRRLPVASRSARNIAAHLLAGSAPVYDAWGGALEDTGARIRYLDKRADILDYLRFADSVPCCFNSTSEWFSGHVGWISDAWRDPLTFCFHIERTQQHTRAPLGFVLGGFALVEQRAAVVLNGIYLRRQSAGIRAAVLRFVESRFCEPMGIEEVGVANSHGGRGRMPKTYSVRSRDIKRVRALSRRGAPVERIYDDVSHVVNRLVSVQLSWRDSPTT